MLYSFSRLLSKLNFWQYHKTAADNSLRHIDPEQAQQLMNQNVQIVDLRTEAHYQNGHIPHAQRVDHHNLESFIRTADLDTPTIVYCYRGISSQDAALRLMEYNFSEVYTLDGGFNLWHKRFPKQVVR